MDSCDKETIKDDLPDRDEKHLETKETCQEKKLMCDTPVNSQVKRKSESRFQNLRKRSTDTVRKDLDDNAIDCGNIKDSDLAAVNSTQYEKQLSPISLPYNKKECIEAPSNQFNQSTSREKNIKYTEESNSAIQEIKTLITEYISSVNDQSKKEQSLENIISIISDRIIHILEKIKEQIVAKQHNANIDKPMSENIHSKHLEIYLYNKDEAKIKDEYLIEKEQMADNEPPKLLEIENSCAKCKQDKIKPISPGKRKSQQIVEDEIKRKRSADNAPKVRNEDKVTGSSKGENSELYASHTKTRDIQLVNTVVSIDNTAKACVIEQDIPVNQTDQSAIKYKRTTRETDFETHELQTSNNESASDQIKTNDEVLLLENSVSSAENRSISFVQRCSLVSSLDNVKEGKIINTQNEIKDESTFKDRSTDSKQDITTKDSSDFRDFLKNRELKLRKEMEKFEKFHGKVSNTNTKVSCDIPLEMSQNSVDTSKLEVSNVSKSRERSQSEELVPPQGTIGRQPFPPLKLFIDSESGLNSLYNGPKSNFINLEQMENDPEFIEHQKQILESISHQRQQNSSMKLDSDHAWTFPKPLENEGPIETDPEYPNNLSSKVKNFFRILDDILKSEGKDTNFLDKSTLFSRLIGIVWAHDPYTEPHIRDLIIGHPERARQSPKAIQILFDRLVKERIKKTDRTLNPVAFADVSPDKYPNIVDPCSPISSPPKNEPDDTISNTDSPELRKHTGLASGQTTVKKDARYQKKFYKQKSTVTLSSSLEIDANIDSKQTQKQSISNDPRIASENREDDVVEENSHDDSKNLLNNLLKEEEKSEDTLSTEKITKLKKDSRYQTLYKLKSLILPTNCSGDADSSEIETNIDSANNQIQRIDDDQRIVSKHSDNTVQKESEEDSNIPINDISKEKWKPLKDKLSETSAIASEYKISSFMEESPNSSQSNSPEINIESWLPSVLEIIPQLEGLAGSSISFASQSSEAEPPPQSPSSEAEPPPQSPSSEVRPSSRNMG